MKTPIQLNEVFEWYTEWLLSHPEKEELILILLDNLNQKALDRIIELHKLIGDVD